MSIYSSVLHLTIVCAHDVTVHGIHSTMSSNIQQSAPAIMHSHGKKEKENLEYTC